VVAIRPKLLNYWGWNFAIVNWGLALLAAPALVGLFRRRDYALGVFALAYLVIGIPSGGLWGFGRYAATLFPLFLGWVAVSEQSEERWTGFLVSFATLAALLAACYGFGVQAAVQ